MSMNPNDSAVVVGISRYPGYADPPRPLPSLQGPDNDAEAVHAWLVKPAGGGLKPEQAKLIRSKDFPDPFRDRNDWGPQEWAIRQALADLKDLPPFEGKYVGRRLYVYVSGHGFAGGRADGALLTAEGKKGRVLHVWISDWFQRLYKAALFKEYVLWMDCCMSREPLTVPQPCDLELQFDRDSDEGLAFTAFSARFPKRAVENVMPNGKTHGVFTYALLDGLRGAAADPETGEVTTEGLKDYLIASMKPLMSADDQENVEVSKQPDFGLQDEIVLARVAPRQARPRIAAAAVPALGALVGFGGTNVRAATPQHRAPGPMPPAPPSSPPSPKQVRLEVRPGSDVAEVFLIDERLRLAARGVGKLKAQVPAGAYVVKVQIGADTVEQRVDLDRDRTLEFGRELPIASPAPFTGTTRSHEFHQKAIAEQGGAAPLRHGAGARILLTARRWSSKDPPPALSAPVSTSPARGVSLWTSRGKLVADLDEVGRGMRDTWDPCVTRAIEVDPGTYTLRWPAGHDGEAEQTLVAVRNWQTQVFLLRDASGGGDERLDIAVLMARGGFAPDNTMLRLAEEVRLALADERQIGSETVTQSVFAKFDDPIMGLMGAHLMLLAHEAEQRAGRRAKTGGGRPSAPVRFDKRLYDEVVENLLGLLGPAHPDVVALATQANAALLARCKPAAVPPMFWRSWPLLVDASYERPALLSAKAAWWRLAETFPTRPYLVWPRPENIATRRAAVMRKVQEAVRSARPGSPEGKSAEDGEMIAARGTSAPPSPLLDPSGERLKRLSRGLLMPRAIIDKAAATLG
jgi:hypothetical protein